MSPRDTYVTPNDLMCHADVVASLCFMPADEILTELQKREESVKNSLTLQCTWHPEYCSYMVEVALHVAWMAILIRVLACTAWCVA